MELKVVISSIAFAIILGGGIGLLIHWSFMKSTKESH